MLSSFPLCKNLQINNLFIYLFIYLFIILLFQSVSLLMMILLLYSVDVDNFAEMSEVEAASIFRVGVR
jgi:hypothetical protein